MEKIDNSLKRLVEKEKTPSVQYLLFDQHHILHQFRTGWADVGNKQQTSEKYSYNAFSVTKTFTALAVLQLAEKGEIDIDNSASRYMKEFPYSRDISVRHLLTHTAGIPNPNPLPWIHRAEDHPAFDRDAFFREVFERHKKLKSIPGTRFLYTNLGYVLLGQLIEQVTGKIYEAYIEEYVIRPLALNKAELGFMISDSSFHSKGYHKKNSLMNWIIGFFIDRKKFRGTAEGKWQPFKPYYINGASHGGLRGRPGSFMKYVQELLREDGKLLSPAYKQMLFTENLTRNQKSTGMCLSWFTDQLNGLNYFAHAGGGGGYYCEVRIYPEAGIGSVIMFNRSGMSNEKFLDKLDRIYFESHPGFN